MFNILDHAVNESISPCGSSESINYDILLQTIESNAKSDDLQLTVFAKSLMWNKKDRGPKTVPWDTLDFTCTGSGIYFQLQFLTQKRKFRA